MSGRGQVRARLAERFAQEDGFLRGLLTGLVIRVAVIIAILAFVVYDGGQLVSAQVKAESVARAAADAGADTFFRTHRVDQAEKDAAAAAEAADPSTKVLSIVIDDKTGTVTVQVQKLANTLVVKHVGFLKKYVTQDATDSEVRTA